MQNNGCHEHQEDVHLNGMLVISQVTTVAVESLVPNHSLIVSVTIHNTIGPLCRASYQYLKLDIVSLHLSSDYRRCIKHLPEQSIHQYYRCIANSH